MDRYVGMPLRKAEKKVAKNGKSCHCIREGETLERNDLENGKEYVVLTHFNNQVTKAEVIGPKPPR